MTNPDSDYAETNFCGEVVHLYSEVSPGERVAIERLKSKRGRIPWVMLAYFTGGGYVLGLILNL
ncbi:MAG TPA: hypothetical protein DDW52_09505 [Planctomycetaceae bacterium]|nr:hypothetical protein [Planctomycetaceae bacterium]